MGGRRGMVFRQCAENLRELRGAALRTTTQIAVRASRQGAGWDLWLDGAVAAHVASPGQGRGPDPGTSRRRAPRGRPLGPRHHHRPGARRTRRTRARGAAGDVGCRVSAGGGRAALPRGRPRTPRSGAHGHRGGRDPGGLTRPRLAAHQGPARVGASVDGGPPAPSVGKAPVREPPRVYLAPLDGVRARGGGAGAGARARGRARGRAHTRAGAHAGAGALGPRDRAEHLRDLRNPAL